MENHDGQFLKRHQDPLSVEEQIKNLRELGLIISDESRATSFLSNVSYYRSIKAYSLGLKPKNGNYFEDITFERIVALYNFDAEMRHLLFPPIEEIEITLRCRLSNDLSLKYGVLGYLNDDFFANCPDRFKESIRREIRRNYRSPSIRNFRENYEDGLVPFYAVTEILSFGTLSKLFKNLKSEDKKQIAKSYGVDYTYFESWIEHMAYIRNICAHYGRLYNAKFSKKPRLYKQYSDVGIRNDRLMGTLVCMKHIWTGTMSWQDFVESIEKLFKKYPDTEILRMGFPENWKSVLIEP